MKVMHKVKKNTLPTTLVLFPEKHVIKDRDMDSSESSSKSESNDPNKTSINPDAAFLTATAEDLTEMLENLPLEATTGNADKAKQDSDLNRIK